MSKMRVIVMATGVAMGLASALCLGGCDNSGGKTGGGTSGGTTGGGDDHGHEHEGEGEHAPGHGTGQVIELGQGQAGPFAIRATRDAGAVPAGGEALIDVWVTGGEVGAVRFWVGTQDGAGSVRARAEVEDPNDPSRYHTHAEIPDPLP